MQLFIKKLDRKTSEKMRIFIECLCKIEIYFTSDHRKQYFHEENMIFYDHK